MSEDHNPDALNEIMYCHPGHIFCNAKQVLVGVDGSDCAARALRVALEVAEMTRSELHIVHVIPTPSITQFAMMSDEDPETVLRKYECGGRRLLEGYLEAAKEYKITVHTHLEQGLPSERLIFLTKKLEIDIVVIGSKGVSSGRRANMGSSTERVVYGVDVPVIVVK